MRFTHELEIERSRAEVWKAFDNPANLQAWQPALQSFEPVSGVPGQPGAVSRLTYREGGREIVLTETVTERRAPEEMRGTYDAGQVVNTLCMRFEEIGPGRTRITCEAEIELGGFMKLAAPMISAMLRARTIADLERFRQKVESGEIA